MGHRVLSMLVIGLLSSACAVPVDLSFPDGSALATPTPGSLQVDADTSLNECWAVAAIDGKQLTVSGTPDLVRGEILLLHQAQQSVIPLSARCLAPASPLGPAELGMVGVFEEVQLATIAGSLLGLAAAPESAFDTTGRVQLCTLPAFTTLTIEAGAVLRPPAPWDATTGVGGVVAVRATEEVIVNETGAIDATGAGFRAGAGSENRTAAAPVDELACTVATDDSGAGKGEGIDEKSFGTFGRGNVGPAAGGGNAIQAGGGGGGGAGPGGAGGTSVSGGAGTEGQGGLGMEPDAPRLLFGGGGGGGHSVSSIGGQAGRGGGAVYIVAPLLRGAGVIAASSTDGEKDVGGGAGGGGGGGTIVLEIPDTTGFGPPGVRAVGGEGGSVNSSLCVGPGGGGGGGGVWARSLTPLQVQVVGGLAIDNPSCLSNAASPGSSGRLVVLE